MTTTAPAPTDTERAAAIHDYLENNYGSDPAIEPQLQRIQKIVVLTDTASLVVDFPVEGENAELDPSAMCNAVLKSGIVDRARIYVAGANVLVNTQCP